MSTQVDTLIKHFPFFVSLSLLISSFIASCSFICLELLDKHYRNRKNIINYQCNLINYMPLEQIQFLCIFNGRCATEWKSITIHSLDEREVCGADRLREKDGRKIISILYTLPQSISLSSWSFNYFLFLPSINFPRIHTTDSQTGKEKRNLFNNQRMYHTIKALFY